MKNLSREERLLRKWVGECSYNHDCHDCEEGSMCGQVFNQIVARLKGADAETKPQVTDELIEEKVEYLYNKAIHFYEHRENCRDFIRKLYEEIK